MVDNKSKSDFAKTSYPPKPSNENYKLGIGDELTLLQIDEIINQTPTANTSEENDSLINVIPSDPSQRVIESSGRIGSDGSVLLLEVGRLNAAGKTLNQLRSEVRNILIRNGVSPRFQLEITQFRSQRAYLTMNANSDVITLDDKQTNLRDILSSAGKGLEPGVVTRVRLQRNLQSFEMNLRDIFSEIAPDITIKDRDHIFVEDIASSTVFTKSMVGQDGTVVLEGIGKLKAAGKN